MKYLLMAMGLLLSSTASAGLFKSDVIGNNKPVDVLVSVMPGKTPNVIDPKTGDNKVLSVKKFSKNDAPAENNTSTQPNGQQEQN